MGYLTLVNALLWESGDLTIPASAMAVVLGVVGTLTTAITYLFLAGRSREKELIAAAAVREKELTEALVTSKDAALKTKDMEIQRWQAIVEKLVPIVEETNRSVARLVTLMERSQAGKPA